MIPDSAPAGPIFGRTAEIDDFAQLLGDRAQSSITLLGGDAGIGKTRLMQEIAAICREAGGVVLVGRCLDLGDSAAPYLPITDIARSLRELPAADGVVSTERLVPSEGVRPVEYFETVATMLDELTGLAPVLVVLEDVHWADRATRELLTYQFTHDVRPGVHVVATYRTDDLHRRHPLRPALAEWSRLPTVRRVLLEPLTAEPSRALVDHLRPGLADPDAGDIIRRSGGNPFFAEELVAASMQPRDAGGPALPGDLADLLLVRADSLDDDPRRVLRAAAVAGSAACDRTLRGLVDLPPERLQDALRAAIDAHLLVTSRDDTYTFRHALLAEAVYDDLLPGERVRLHDTLTDILLECGDSYRPATLAMHAEQAGRFETALQARLRAGDDAMETAAPSNAARHFEAAISLAAWHPELTDVPTDLPRRAARALLAAGDPHRATELVRDALRTHSGTLVERAELLRLFLSALLLTDLPTTSTKLGIDGLPDDADELLDVGIGWARECEENVLLGKFLALRARYLLSFERHDEAAVAAGDALLVGRAVDEPMIITDAMTTQAKLDGLAGDMTSALTTLEHVRQQAAAEGDIRAELRALHQLAGLQARADQHTAAAATFDKAVRRATEAHARTELYGLDSLVFGATLAAKMGDWGHVDELLADTDALPRIVTAAAAAVRETVDVARGRFDRALAAHEELRSHWSQDMFIVAHDAPATIDVLGATGDLAGAVAVYDEAVATVRRVWRLPVFDAEIRMTALLLTHIADAVAVRPREATDWSARVEQLNDTLEEILSVRGWRESLGEESRAWFARAQGELARLAGNDALAVDEYREAVKLFENAGFVYEQAVAELSLSRALQVTGELSEARTLSGHALATARRLGATHLIAQLRGRPRAETGRGSGLTPRERDVLQLVAEGMTNGQIAGKLFISTKTASVHVSNILAKLGAANRTEAVDLARQQGELD
ncbi:helix-turn-helix transcriptional regulator [Flexivirga endophytica]|uniref:helix-turn-helix transcriptional regulator n=1 Tax=Flexivirga endophytica TaxID=1849103 RepID=UPI001665D627|nr:helix-turn-helix transcriptional regulator [Flexivirga endophytica]